RANALLQSEVQVLVDWPAASDQPSIEGDPAMVGVFAPHRVLAFGSWLDAGQARAMEEAVDALRARGEAFAMTLTTLAGSTIEVQGRAVAGRAVLRLKDLSAVKRELLQLAGRHEALLKQCLVASRKLQELALDGAQILEPQYRAPGDGAALHFDRRTGERRQRHRKRLAAGAQCVDRLLHRPRLAGIEPATESEDAMRRENADHGGIALD